MHAAWWRAFCGRVRRNVVPLARFGFGSELWRIARQFGVCAVGDRLMRPLLGHGTPAVVYIFQAIGSYCKTASDLEGCNGCDGCGLEY